MTHNTPDLFTAFIHAIMNVKTDRSKKVMTAVAACYDLYDRLAKEDYEHFCKEYGQTPARAHNAYLEACKQGLVSYPRLVWPNFRKMYEHGIREVWKNLYPTPYTLDGK